jgi:hypothetical protein
VKLLTVSAREIRTRQPMRKQTDSRDLGVPIKYFISRRFETTDNICRLRLAGDVLEEAFM